MICGSGRKPHFTAFAVEHERVAILDTRQQSTQRSHHRNTKRPRDNHGVGGVCAFLKRDAL